MSQSNMLKEDILKILSKSVKGGSNTRPTYQSAKEPKTFFGGENQPYYPLAQEPNPAASAMSPIVPSIIRDKDPSKRPTYKSAKQPKTFFGGETECAKAKKLVKEKCGKTKRAPSAYNLFIKQYFAENSNASMKSAAAAWKLSKPSSKAAPKNRPKIALTTFGDVPPPPDTPAPKKKKLIIKKKLPEPPKKKLVLLPPSAFVADIKKTPSPPKKKAPKTPPPKKKKKKAADIDGVESEDDFEFDITTPAARRTSTFRPTPTKPRSLADELKAVDDPQALLDSSVDQYGIDDDEPAPKKKAPKKKAAPKKKIPKAAIAKAKTELEKRTGLTKAQANKLSPTELFGMLPPEIRRMILDPKITGVKVGNRVLLKDFDMTMEEEFYEPKEYMRDNIFESNDYYGDYSEYLSKRDAAFWKENFRDFDSLSRKEQDRYETIQEKYRDKVEDDVYKTWNKLYKDWKKTTGKKETDTEDNWLMRFIQYVVKSGYTSIVDGSDKPEYYVKKREAAAKKERERLAEAKREREAEAKKKAPAPKRKKSIGRPKNELEVQAYIDEYVDPIPRKTLRPPPNTPNTRYINDERENRPKKEFIEMVMEDEELMTYIAEFIHAFNYAKKYGDDDFEEMKDTLTRALEYDPSLSFDTEPLLNIVLENPRIIQFIDETEEEPPSNDVMRLVNAEAFEEAATTLSLAFDDLAAAANREDEDSDDEDAADFIEHNGKEYVVEDGKVFLVEDDDTIDDEKPIKDKKLIKIIKSKAKKSGGNIRNTGKPLPKKQLKSASGKANSTKKNTSWLSHVAEFRKANPSIKNRDVMREAKKTYNKSGGAELVVDNNKIETHKMPDGSVMSGKTHSKISELVKQKKAGNVPEAPQKQDKKSDDDQSKIMVDIMNSFDVFNNRFGAISNSAGTIEEKKTQYNNERAKLEKYHEDIIKNYKDSLSSSNMEIATKAYNYAAETYKIGVDNLTAGVPTQRVDFENFDDNDTITEIIDKQLAVPRTALDRAKSFYSVPIPEAKIQNFSPKVPSLGNMASIYPYGRQQAEKMIMGGRVKKDPKKLITELTKDLFIRDMKKKYPRRSLKEIKSAYQKYKKDIESIMTDAIVDSMKIRGGADCAANQYSSGDRCYNKQERPDNFDRNKFDAEQKRQAASNQRKDDGMVKMPDPIATTKLDTTTRRTIGPANPMPSPKPQPKNEKDFVSKFSAAVTPPDSGPIFGTDGSDITDPRAWVDTIGNIAVGTFKGVESIFDALGSIF